MRRLLVMSSLVLAACSAGEGKPTAGSQAPVVVEAAKPVRRDVVRKLAIVASFEPLEQAVLFAKTSGFVREIRVDRGDRVKKGDLIAVLDVPEAQTEIQRVVAEEKQARAMVEQSKAELRLHETTAKRLAAIRAEEAGAVSQQDLDLANGKVDSAKTAVATADSRFDVLRADGQRLRTLAGYARITAPFDGVVTDRYVDTGAFVGSGTSGKAGQIVKLVNAKKLRLMVDIPEVDVSHVAVGNAAKIEVDAVADTTFEGKVSRRSEALDPASRTMRVEIEVDNADGRLVPGMFGRVRMDLETRRDVLTCDPKWLKLQKDQAYVLVVRDGVARRVNVKLGADDGKVAEVIDGLTGDEDVIVAAVGGIVDGAPCVIKSEPASGSAAPKRN